MFLAELNERERKNFLELAYHTMQTDGEVSGDEKEIFDNFRAETRLNESNYEIQEKDFDKIVRDFKASTNRTQKVVLFELFGIILADEEYHEKEEDLVNKLIAEWNFREYHAKKIRRWVEDFNDLLMEAYMFLEE